MAILTTTRDQIRVGAAAKRAGGYEELIRLDREKRAAGPGAILKREPGGRLRYVRADTALRQALPEEQPISSPPSGRALRDGKSPLAQLRTWLESLSG
ncbi:MAG: hypothetical protein DI526_14990 [Caulobacter segnis]|uniref:Uncharacterized protein n=1 Tax=Caulobacter segnis TaxID=88688 RepID=A0A2W5X7N2_9CAUL|nr:MAG: hypothetical protein DI526_14990 [Caulobacter segnis]